MTAIGGFFGMEPGREDHGPWHTNASALTSGRACFRAVLEMTRPARVLVPFYICDAALVPLKRLGIPFEFYGVTRSLDPLPAEWPSDASVLYANYFDLKACGADTIAGALAGRAIVDDTQAFFRRGHGSAWSFNSARKFFGVPDGAYLYGPRAADVHPARANEGAPAEHLRTTAAGGRQLAYRQYVEAESRVSDEVLAPSSLTRRTLNAVAYEEAKTARRRNFGALHARLGAVNTLQLPMTLDAGAVPFCYPFLPARGDLHERLWRQEIFVPRLWPEVIARESPGFEWERELAKRLLPLPVDHRYTPDAMTRVGDAVIEGAA